MEEGVQKIGFGIFQVLLSFFCGAIGVKLYVWNYVPWIILLYSNLFVYLCLFTLQLVEAFEVMILAVLSAALKCDWGLDEIQMATITTVAALIMLYSVIEKYVQWLYIGCVSWRTDWYSDMGHSCWQIWEEKGLGNDPCISKYGVYMCMHACAYMAIMWTFWGRKILKTAKVLTWKNLCLCVLYKDMCSAVHTRKF